MKTASAIELTTYLHEHIPLSAAMQVQVVSCDAAGVHLAAPLSPNLNHRGTAFGGSVSSLAILSAWAFLHGLLQNEGVTSRIVIQKSDVDYLNPINGEFSAFCPAPDTRTLDAFTASLRRKGKARIHLDATVTCGPIEAARFSGDYVALVAQPGEAGS